MTLPVNAHKSVLLRVLKDLFTDPVAGPVLGFKGGTAAYLFHGLDRFSVDLDFDLLDTNREQQVFDLTRMVLEQYGSLKECRKKRFSLFFLLAYADKEPGAQNVKVEINRRRFGSAYEVKTYLGIPMNVMVRQDMAAHKLVALYERRAATTRDIFDIQFFLRNNWPVRRRIVEERTGMAFPDFLDACIALVEKKKDRDMLVGIGELLDEGKKEWVRRKLKQEAIFLLRLLKSEGADGR
jgi:predicted nucleotidyltransferase component of viral defense system